MANQYYVQKDLLASQCRTIVKDAKGTPLFLLVGRWGTRGDALSLYTLNGEIVASLKQKNFGIRPRFDLYLGYEKVGSMQKIFSFQQDFYYVHKLRWSVIGDIPNHHYTIHKKNTSIMEMEEQRLINGDYYQLTVEKDEDAPLCICIAAVLDYWLLNRKKQKKPFPMKPVNFDLS